MAENCLQRREIITERCIMCVARDTVLRTQRVTISKQKICQDIIEKEGKTFTVVNIYNLLFKLNTCHTMSCDKKKTYFDDNI